MKRFFNCLVLATAILFFQSCGGSGDTATLTTDQINNISAALTGGLNATYEGMGAPTPTSVSIDATSFPYTYACNPGDCQFTMTPNGTYDCSGGGHITMTGNITIACTETTTTPAPGSVTYCSGNWYTSMAVVFHVSDETNNLNDCDVGGGVILDGTVNFTASGTDDAISANINGTIDIDERGPTGGLVPIAPACYIFISYPHGGNPSGTICGNTVS